MTCLFMLYLALAQSGQSVELPGIRLVSVRSVVTAESEFSSQEHSIFELGGENLDLSFYMTDMKSTVLLVNGSPCFYVRSRPRKGWCVVHRKVDFAKESIWGPVIMYNGDLYGPEAGSSRDLTKPDLTARSLKAVPVLAPMRFKTFLDLLVELERAAKDERKP
jgi:hypothetical protein